MSNIWTTWLIMKKIITILIGVVISISSCHWTAEFDWSYILSGEFKITINGDELLMIRSYGENVYNKYKLTRVCL